MKSIARIFVVALLLLVLFAFFTCNRSEDKEKTNESENFFSTDDDSLNYIYPNYPISQELVDLALEYNYLGRYSLPNFNAKGIDDLFFLIQDYSPRMVGLSIQYDTLYSGMIPDGIELDRFIDENVYFAVVGSSEKTKIYIPKYLITQDPRMTKAWQEKVQSPPRNYFTLFEYVEDALDFEPGQWLGVTQVVYNHIRVSVAMADSGLGNITKYRMQTIMKEYTNQALLHNLNHVRNACAYPLDPLDNCIHFEVLVQPGDVLLTHYLDGYGPVYDYSYAVLKVEHREGNKFLANTVSTFDLPRQITWNKLKHRFQDKLYFMELTSDDSCW